MRILALTFTLLSLAFAVPGWGQDLLPEEIDELNEECLDCHEDMDKDESEYVFASGKVIYFQVNPENQRASAHGRILACMSCHEDYDDDHPDFEYPGEREYAQIRSELCQSCHEDVAPLHPVAEGDEAPLCADCHSAHRDRSFEVSPSDIIERCGVCHESELADFRKGGHAESISPSSPNPDLPQCNTCHPAHDEPEGSTLRLTTRVTTLCIDCHSSSRLVLKYEQTGTAVASYMEDFHGLTFQHLLADLNESEQEEIMTCATCHGPHNVAPLEEDQLAEICAGCHDGTSTLFAGAWLGHGEIGPGHGILVWIVRMSYRVLIPFMLLGLILNIIIQLRYHFRRRSEVGVGAGPAEESTNELIGPVIRFSNVERAEHMLVALLFTMLILTGLPQSYPQSSLAGGLIDLWGGIAATRLIHRTCGFIFAGLMVLHILRGVIGTVRRHQQPDILPTPKDFQDIFESLRHHLGKGPAPRFGKFDYGEKFEYMGLLLGSCLIAGTGFLLVFPEVATTYLPGIILAAARMAHGYEATLALLVVLVWHLWGVTLRPEVFPFDTSIFTGKIGVDRLREEHGLWYDKLMSKGALEK